MKSILNFDSMLTPKIITFVYWLLLLGSIVWGVMIMFSGYGGLTIGTFFAGIAAMVGSAIGARIWCELLIVLFKINENIRTLAEKS